jgi:hypothetical protein
MMPIKSWVGVCPGQENFFALFEYARFQELIHTLHCGNFRIETVE